jgi:hypothetical protein
VVAVLPLPAGLHMQAHVHTQVKNCSPAAIGNALALGG